MDGYRLSRRAFLKSAALTTTASLLAACAPKALETTQAPGEPTKAVEQPTVEATAEPTPAPITVPPAKDGKLLRYWTGWGGPSYRKALTQIMASDGFKAILGNNGFELKTGVAEEAMLTAVAGGDPPDTGTNINYLGFMSRGVLLPITDYVSASTLTKKEDYIETCWNLGFYKGVMYGLPTQESFLRYGLEYNTKLVTDAGLDPNAPPETWDDLYAWHEKLTKKDSAGNLTQLGSNPYGSMGSGWWDTDGGMMPTSWDLNWFDEKTGKFDLNNAKMVDAFKTFKKFVDLAGVEQMSVFYNVSGRDNWNGAYQAGVEATNFQGYWNPGEIANSMPEISKVNKVSWLPVPSSRKGVKTQLAGGHSWTIFKDSKTPDVMFKIGEYLNTQEPCQIIWDNLGWLPAVKSFLDKADASKYPGLDFYFMSYKEATEWHTPPRCEITTFVSNEFITLGDKVDRGEMTAEQAAEELQKRVVDEYKNQGFGG